MENYDAQVLCMGQNVIAAPAAWALVDIWLDLRHDTSSGYATQWLAKSRHSSAGHKRIIGFCFKQTTLLYSAD